MPKWTAQDMPDQAGRVILITGANSGLGFETTRAFARKNATVVMACRNLQKAQSAHDAVIAETPNARLDLMELNLADLESVKAFADAFRAKYNRLDILYNNAGVMALPYSKTVQGFEMQFGTNHLGHFALTGHLLDMILATDNSRVVTVTSNAHVFGRMNFDDINHERNYERWQAYGQAKLANALFAEELARRLKAIGSNTKSLAAHPGLAQTQLQVNMADNTGTRFDRIFSTLGMDIMSQSQEMGALPQLYAGTMPDANNGDYYAPTIAGIRGWPQKRKLAKHAYDETSARRLWEVSEEMTGIRYEALQSVAV